MKRISKNKIEFDCIVRSVETPILTSIHGGDDIEVIVNYFDREDDINLVMKGNYKSEYLEYLQQAYREMKIIKIVIEVKEKDKNG